MKKYIAAIWIALILMNCRSAEVRHQNSQNLPNDQMVKVLIDESITVHQINDEPKIIGGMTFGSMDTELYLAPGEYTFVVSYHSGYEYSVGKMIVKHKLEAGKIYRLDHMFYQNRILVYFKELFIRDETDEAQANQIKVRYIAPFIWSEIFSGSINDIKSTLDPVPSGFDNIIFAGELDIYLLKNFGISVGGEYGLLSAVAAGYDSLSIGTLPKINAGVIYKVVLYDSNKNVSQYKNDKRHTSSELDLKLAAGLNYNFFSLSNDYKNIFTGVSFYENPATGLGFYTGTTLEYVGNHIIYGLGAYLNYSSFKFVAASRNMDIWNVAFPVYIGYEF